MATYEEMVAQYKKLAKRADQQLKRLEQLSTQEHYKGVLKYAYGRAERDIAAFERGQQYDKPRFNRNIPKRKDQLQARIIDVTNFLESKTNTKSKITNVYKERANTVNKKYGTNFKWQDLANFYESSQAEKLDSQYGSKTLLKAIGSIKKKNIKLEDIEKVKLKNQRLSDDDVVNEVAIKLLKQGLSVNELFGGN